MMRRYSRPRTFTPGCTRPGVGTEGLTTMPSPPAAVSSSHQAVASARDSGEPRVTKTCRVVVISGESSSASVDRCQACGSSAVARPSQARIWNGATLIPSRPSTGQQ